MPESKEAEKLRLQLALSESKNELIKLHHKLNTGATLPRVHLPLNRPAGVVNNETAVAEIENKDLRTALSQVDGLEVQRAIVNAEKCGLERQLEVERQAWREQFGSMNSKVTELELNAARVSKSHAEDLCQSAAAARQSHNRLAERLSDRGSELERALWESVGYAVSVEDSNSEVRQKLEHALGQLGAQAAAMSKERLVYKDTVSMFAPRLRQAAMCALCRVFRSRNALARSKAFSTFKDGYVTSKHARELAESQAIVAYAGEAQKHMLLQTEKLRATMDRVTPSLTRIKAGLFKGGFGVLRMELRHGEQLAIAMAFGTMQSKMHAHGERIVVQTRMETQTAVTKAESEALLGQLKEKQHSQLQEVQEELQAMRGERELELLQHERQMNAIEMAHHRRSQEEHTTREMEIDENEAETRDLRCQMEVRQDHHEKELQSLQDAHSIEANAREEAYRRETRSMQEVHQHEMQTMLESHLQQAFTDSKSLRMKLCLLFVVEHLRVCRLLHYFCSMRASFETERMYGMERIHVHPAAVWNKAIKRIGDHAWRLRGQQCVQAQFALWRQLCGAERMRTRSACLFHHAARMRQVARRSTALVLVPAASSPQLVAWVWWKREANRCQLTAKRVGRWLRRRGVSRWQRVASRICADRQSREVGLGHRRRKVFMQWRDEAGRTIRKKWTHRREQLRSVWQRLRRNRNPPAFPAGTRREYLKCQTRITLQRWCDSRGSLKHRDVRHSLHLDILATTQCKLTRLARGVAWLSQWRSMANMKRVSKWKKAQVEMAALLTHQATTSTITLREQLLVKEEQRSQELDLATDQHEAHYAALESEAHGKERRLTEAIMQVVNLFAREVELLRHRQQSQVINARQDALSYVFALGQQAQEVATLRKQLTREQDEVQRRSAWIKELEGSLGEEEQQHWRKMAEELRRSWHKAHDLQNRLQADDQARQIVGLESDLAATREQLAAGQMRTESALSEHLLQKELVTSKSTLRKLRSKEEALDSELWWLRQDALSHAAQLDDLEKELHQKDKFREVLVKGGGSNREALLANQLTQASAKARELQRQLVGSKRALTQAHATSNEMANLRSKLDTSEVELAQLQEALG